MHAYPHVSTSATQEGLQQGLNGLDILLYRAFKGLALKVRATHAVNNTQMWPCDQQSDQDTHSLAGDKTSIFESRDISASGKLHVTGDKTRGPILIGGQWDVDHNLDQLVYLLRGNKYGLNERAEDKNPDAKRRAYMGKKSRLA